MCVRLLQGAGQHGAGSRRVLRVKPHVCGICVRDGTITSFAVVLLSYPSLFIPTTKLLAALYKKRTCTPLKCPPLPRPHSPAKTPSHPLTNTSLVPKKTSPDSPLLCWVIVPASPPPSAQPGRSASAHQSEHTAAAVGPGASTSNQPSGGFYPDEPHSIVAGGGPGYAPHALKPEQGGSGGPSPGGGGGVKLG